MSTAARGGTARRPETQGSQAAQAAANAASVAEAVRTGRFPERLDPMVPPRPFDEAAFVADPQAYVNVVEPGRVFQDATAGPEVKTIEAAGVAYAEIEPGGSTRLTVKAAPGAAVTFTSFDGGVLDNELPSMTVLASASGEAAVTFTATPGTVELVTLLAASPLTVGQVKFTVQVESAERLSAGQGTDK